MRRALLAAALLLTFASSAAAAPTKAAYIKRADQLCKTGNAKLRVLEPALNRVNFNSASGITKAVKLFNREFKIETVTYKQLIALPKPAGDEATLKRLWRTVATATGYLKKTTTDLKNLNVPAMKKDLKAADAARASYKRIAKSYGFHYCGVK